MLKPSRALSLFPSFKMVGLSKRPREPYRPFQGAVVAVVCPVTQGFPASQDSQVITLAQVVIQALVAIQGFQASAAYQVTLAQAYQAFQASQGLAFQAFQDLVAFLVYQGFLDSQGFRAFQVTLARVYLDTQDREFLATQASLVLVYQVSQVKAASQACRDSLDYQDFLDFLATRDLAYQAIQVLAFLAIRDFLVSVYQAFQASQDFPASQVYQDSLASQAFLVLGLQLPFPMKV
jgi:hypothetical protein